MKKKLRNNCRGDGLNFSGDGYIIERLEGLQIIKEKIYAVIKS